MKKTYSLEYFAAKKWSFVFIKNGKIVFRSKADRLKPLIECIGRYKEEMRGGVVFDKIVGRAAAFLLTHAKVSEVWTPVIGRGGRKILENNKIKVKFGRETENIMNQKGDDLCPMEKMSLKKGNKIIDILLGN